MRKRPMLEICLASVEDAVAAEAAGADRLELNSAISMGGLTPSAGLIAEVTKAVRLPIIVIVRPRAGGFHYSESDFTVMLHDIDFALQQGAAGIAFGVLTENGEIDVLRSQQIVRRVGRAEVVFHRAFDLTPDPHRALRQLIDLGIRRVMTSGQSETALTGAATIADLVNQGRDLIEILPAGGIKPSNVVELISRTGCRQVHASLRRTRVDSSMAQRPAVRFSNPSAIPEQQFEETDPVALAKMIETLNSLAT